jgi:signal transduction histidine kinase
MQAMEKRGGTLTVATAADGGTVRFTVSDTGVGSAASDMEKLFEPNFSTKTGGTGLGLAISKAVVENSGGTIEVESKVGVGTTVTVRLPTV